MAETKLKIILLGNGGAGKTSIARRYTENRFLSSYRPSLGVDFMVKRLIHKGYKIKVMVFDTAGQEFIASLRQRYYFAASGAVIVYDITSRKSFDLVGKWVDELRREAGEIKTMLVANKLDLQKQRVVSTEEGEDYAKKIGAEYFEVSAATGWGVDGIFQPFVELAV
ncbi:MAG: GTP-binding protein [Candidatus Heimdallarchaeota archaeon]|nr:GTP-binding protein [Candidatus Heimdallarchaeota archaeon]